MGHEQLQAGPDPGVLHPMGQDIIEYDRALWDSLMVECRERTIKLVYKNTLICSHNFSNICSVICHLFL